MARVFLIDPPFYALQNIPSGRLSFGLAMLAAVLKKNHHECLIFDGEHDLIHPPYNTEKILVDVDLFRSNLDEKSELMQTTFSRIIRHVDEFKPDIIGVTIPTAKYAVALQIINRVKSYNKDITVIVGGPHPTILPDETLENSDIDIVIRGEGEQVLVEVIKALENQRGLDKINGISYREENIIRNNPPAALLDNLDSLPFPAWEAFHNFKELAPDSFGSVFTSRGCPYKCSFCASHRIWSRKVRYQSAKRVLDELEYISKRFGTKNFRINDDTFILNRERVIEICDGILDRGLGIKWSCEIRADLCEVGLLKKMKAAGCDHVNLGIESGNEETLKLIDKGLSLEQIHRAVRVIKDVGLYLVGYFMVGFPNETERHINDTIKLMKTLKVDYPCWSIVAPYPGTPLYQSISENAHVKKNDWTLWFHHTLPSYPLEKISPVKLAQLVTRIDRLVARQQRSQRLKARAINNMIALKRLLNRPFAK